MLRNVEAKHLVQDISVFLTFFFFIAQNATILYNIYHSKTQFARLNRSVTRNHWETRRRSPEFEIPQLSRLTGNGVVID